MTALTCPRCMNEKLLAAEGPRGIPVWLCPACAGLWLDKSEIYYYAENPQKLFDVIADAYRSPAASRFLCRRCDVQMCEVTFPKPGPVIDACRQCGGTWFDKGEVDALLLLTLQPKG